MPKKKTTKRARDRQTVRRTDVGQVPAEVLTETPTRSRAEIEAEIRALNPRCRGPRNPEPSDALQRLSAQTGLPDPVALALHEAAEAGHETTDAAISALLAESQSEAHRQAAGLLDAATRAGCGYDVAELYLSEPLDGLPHEKPCPQCGQTIRWTPPKEAA
jgi:hypothetical protein